MLLAYVFGVLKPLSPIVNDIVQHVFNEASHMATIHYEDGKYHVHKELAVEQSPESTKKGNTDSFSSEELLANHLQSSTYNFKGYYKQILVINTETDTRFFDIFSKTFSPPPEA